MLTTLALLSLLTPAVDLIAVNGKVITIDGARPRATAFAVKDGKFVAVGADAEIRRLAQASTKILDLKGRSATPGFNDNHLHPRPIFPHDSPYATLWLGPDRVDSIDGLVALLRLKAAQTPAGQLITGIGYQDTKLSRHPNRRDLDRATTQHPILIHHSSGHISAVNSFALRQAGITASTANPAGGSFDRFEGNGPDANEPNGVVRESARSLLRLKPIAVPEAAQVEGLARCLRNFAAKGITSINVAGVNPEDFALYEKAQQAGGTVRVGLMLREQFVDIASRFLPGHPERNPMLYWTSLKAFQGNSMSGRTCWLSEEYSDRPGYFGIPPARGQEDFDRLVKRAHDQGMQMAVHANGDREIDMVLTAVERAQKAKPRPNARHRIEHASVCTPALLARAKAAGVILVFHSYMWEHGDKLEAYGEKRLRMVHPHRTALDMGIHVAAHSDYPVSAADSLLRLSDLVRRQSESGKIYGPNQRISVEEALRVSTLGSAYATFEEDVKGSISPGKYADFVVLAEDPLSVPAERLKDIAIDEVFLGGRSVFARNP
ncbi:MAG: amidohydrolase [Bryobacter sp.]